MHIPEKGLSKEEILGTLQTFKAQDMDWKAGKVWCYVYNPGEDPAEVSREAYMAFLTENGLDPSVFLSMLKLETDVVRAIITLLRGDEKAVGHLTTGGTDLLRHGKADWVYFEEVFNRNWQTYWWSPDSSRIAYAVKANGNLAVLGLMRRLGTGADIVSGGELARCLRAGFAPSDIVYSGVGKTGPELAEAAAIGLDSINVESLEELPDLGRVAGALGRSVRVGIRFNPDVTADTHPYISTGQSGIKSGVPSDQVTEVVAALRAHPALELRTIAIHIGSQITSVDPYRRGAARLVELWAALREAGISSVTALDIGGGLGIRHFEEEPPTPVQLAEAVVPATRPTGLRMPNNDPA